jgi:hypothetical protein
MSKRREYEWKMIQRLDSVILKALARPRAMPPAVISTLQPLTCSYRVNR